MYALTCLHSFGCLGLHYGNIEISAKSFVAHMQEFILVRDITNKFLHCIHISVFPWTSYNVCIMQVKFTDRVNVSCIAGM